VIPLQQRLVVEGVHLGRAAVHEQKNHALRSGREVRLFDRQRIRAGSRPQLLFAQEPCQRDGPKRSLLKRIARPTLIRLQ
jgi:hypothetical protein